LCGLKVEGEFVMNEFGSLTPDELHFLRVFVFCEGRIRDMEAALGVSYPTVKGHMASIKEKLNLSVGRPPAPAESGLNAAAPPGSRTEDEILDELETGQISYKEAIRLLRAKRKKEAKANEQQGG
jgi:hypothetical protein